MESLKDNNEHYTVHQLFKNYEKLVNSESKTYVSNCRLIVVGNCTYELLIGIYTEKGKETPIMYINDSVGKYIEFIDTDLDFTTTRQAYKYLIKELKRVSRDFIKMSDDIKNNLEG